MNHELTLRIILENPPAGVDYGIQKGSGSKYETIQRQRSDSHNLQFEFTVTVKTNKDFSTNFLGAVVRGTPDNRFIYIDIGTCAGQADSQWSRRLKIPLKGIAAEVIKEATSDSGKCLETKVAGTGRDSGPNCGTVKPFTGWHLSAKY